jgi:hypothetical protein
MAWSRALSFNDPFAYSLAIQAVDAELLPTDRGDFRGEVTQVRMKRLWMQRFEVNLPQITAGASNTNRKIFTFLSDASSGKVQHCGLDISPGMIFAAGFNPGHLRSEANLRLASMS